MVYLDYLLYIVLIVLLCILINNLVIDMNKEGFSHKGQAVLASTKPYESVIKSAEYGYFDPDSWTDVSGFVISKFKKTSVVDAKPMLDKIIKKGTKEIIISNETFGIVDPAPGMTKYLIIHFKKPDVTVSDAAYQVPDYRQYPDSLFGNPDRARMMKSLSGAYMWIEADTMSLKFGNYSTDSFWIKTTQSLYKIAELFAKIVILYPYKFIRNFMVTFGNVISFKLPNLFKRLGDVFKRFINSLIRIAKDIFKKVFGLVKTVFKKIISIIKDIPGFLEEIFNFIIDFIEKVVSKTFELLGRIFKSVVKIIKTIITLPLMIFDILGKLLDFILNLIQMIIELPISMLNMILAFQEILMDIMNKSPTIPFLDMFFK